MNDIHNETLAETYVKGGAPLRMELTLQQNENEFSGYAWTEGKGPQARLIAGTGCDVTLIVDQKRPIDTWFQYLKRN